jgi:hypothetical protein
MSPSEFVDDNTRELFVNNWKFCASEAANRAETFEMLGISKSIINRILEPYNTINVLMTGASAHWEWLFKQRTAEDAEPNLRELVLMMQEQYRAATPVDRSMHLPFIDEKDRFIQGYDHLKVSVARCARLSYTPFGEPARNTEADLKLADRLLESLHLSPFEHIVVDDRAAPDIVKWTNSDGVFYDEMFGEIIGATENAISDEVWTFRQLLGF